LSAFITVTFIVLPSVSLTVFQSFSCDDETNTLNADPLVICNYEDESYVSIKMIGWLGFILYPFGVPIVYFYLLGSHYGSSFADMKVSERSERALRKTRSMNPRNGYIHY
jgi:hypothetical protein